MRFQTDSVYFPISWGLYVASHSTPALPVETAVISPFPLRKKLLHRSICYLCHPLASGCKSGGWKSASLLHLWYNWSVTDYIKVQMVMRELCKRCSHDLGCASSARSKRLRPLSECASTSSASRAVADSSEMKWQIGRRISQDRRSKWLRRGPWEAEIHQRAKLRDIDRRLRHKTSRGSQILSCTNGEKKFMAWTRLQREA